MARPRAQPDGTGHMFAAATDTSIHGGNFVSAKDYYDKVTNNHGPQVTTNNYGVNYRDYRGSAARAIYNDNARHSVSYYGPGSAAGPEITYNVNYNGPSNSLPPSGSDLDAFVQETLRKAGLQNYNTGTWQPPAGQHPPTSQHPPASQYPPTSHYPPESQHLNPPPSQHPPAGQYPNVHQHPAGPPPPEWWQPPPHPEESVYEYDSSPNRPHPPRRRTHGQHERPNSYEHPTGHGYEPYPHPPRNAAAPRDFPPDPSWNRGHHDEDMDWEPEPDYPPRFHHAEETRIRMSQNIDMTSRRDETRSGYPRSNSASPSPVPKFKSNNPFRNLNMAVNQKAEIHAHVPFEGPWPPQSR
ncbi:hypothetical protein CC1G_02144 [Coprinopsis cinerea okayama7|uniref:Uncharacterized protein n=1 Tax=Coprinopsis cinerea (strain Okayama-7 / 130 / ATCC MYA-4618 / FGSC 9003) TaxID=240176 RepID=A8NKC4_COPC7|nr:hypothetical protein CC1G_02144 [Coprinopsis cinerea okayama7\|eukprot:XP_001834408.2 hypothetical protein CC1G_02144 [Coprinopsis cinerea okayama7\